MSTPFEHLAAWWTHEHPGPARCGDLIAAVPFVKLGDAWEVIDTSFGGDAGPYWLPISHQFGVVVRMSKQFAVLIPCLIEEQFDSPDTFERYLGYAREGKLDGWLALPPIVPHAPKGTIAMVAAPQAFPAGAVHDMTEKDGQRIAGMTLHAQHVLRDAMSGFYAHARAPVGPGHGLG